MRSTILLAASLFSAAPAVAQTNAPAPASSAAGNRTGGLGAGLGGLLGGGLPNIGAVGASNAAGLLGYCLQNNLLGGATARGTGSAAGGAASQARTAGGAQAVLDRLMGRQGVTASPAFEAGRQGQVQTPAGGTVALDGLRGQVRNQMCSLVLNRARALI